MRWVFLVAGFAAGLAVGLAFSHRETPRAARPRAPVIVREERATSDTPPDEPQPSESDLAAPVVIEPTGDLSEEEAEHSPGYGRIEVDFDGFDGQRKAWVAQTTLSGSREEEDVVPDDDETVALFEVIPGVCDVWWLRGPYRVGTRVKVVAGRVVRIRAAEFDAARIPRELAVLGVHVGASWGGSLPFFQVAIEARDNGLRFRTNRHGCASVTLRPGTVTVKVGDQVTPVALVGGRETVLEVSHRTEGDVLFDPLHAGGAARIGLRPVGARRYAARPRYKGLDRDGFLYVKAGDYEVVRRVGRAYFGGTVLGTVRVLAGRASVFRVELPPGVLEIRVEVAEENARKAPYALVTIQNVVHLRPFGATAGQVGGGFAFLDQVQGARVAYEGRHAHFVRIDGLHPGKYRLVCGAAIETVEVGTGVTKVVLRPPR
jgi:hypothetical protein